MNIYKVTNGIYDDGYYRDKDMAQLRAEEINKFIDDNKDAANMNKDKWFVQTIETVD